METAWFICPYKRILPQEGPFPRRQCCIEEYGKQIRADGGKYAYGEVLGNMGIVKVKASGSTLAAITFDPEITRLPKTLLHESLSDLSSAQKKAIVNKLTAMGYSVAELRADLGNDLSNKTLEDVLQFAAKRRLKPRWDRDNDQIVIDGPLQWVKPISLIDEEVQ